MPLANEWVNKKYTDNKHPIYSVGKKDICSMKEIENRVKKESVDFEFEKAYKKHGNKSLNSTWLRNNGYNGMLQRICNIYGSWNNFLKSKGFKLNHITKYTQEFVDLEFEEVRKKHENKALNSTWLINNGYRGMVNRIRNIYGSWNNFLKSKGFKLNRIREYDQKSVDLEFEEVLKKYGNKALNGAWLRNNGYEGLHIRIYKIYGSWNKFLKSKRFKLTLVREYDQKSVDLEFEEALKKHGNKSLNGAWLRNNGYNGMLQRICNIYGSWNKFLKIKGFKLNIVNEYDQKSVDLEFEEVLKKHGNKALNSYWLINNGCHGMYQRILNIYGSWTNAINHYMFSYHMTEADMRI